MLKAATTIQAGTPVAKSMTFTYDAANRMLYAGSNTYAYDDDGNLASKTNATGTVQYEYNAAGKLSRVAYDDGTDVRYTYGLGSVTDLTDRTGDEAMQYRYVPSAASSPASPLPTTPSGSPARPTTRRRGWCSSTPAGTIRPWAGSPPRTVT